MAVGLLLACGAAYLAAALRARRWPWLRSAVFVAGLAVLGVALQSSLHTRAEELLSAHMIQHLLVTLVAAPLLVLGAPLTLLLRTFPAAQRRALARVLKGRLGLLASVPLAFTLFTVVLVGSHAPAVYEAALRNDVLHAVQHALYFWTALLLWLPLLGSEPLPRRPSPLVKIVVLLAAMPAMALVGVGLMSQDSAVYASYVESARSLGVSAVEDQHAAGAIMWLGGTIVLASAALVVGWASIRGEHERQRVRESYAGGSARSMRGAP